VREVRRPSSNAITIYEQDADGTSHARLFLRRGDGRWDPPLPADVAAALPVERSRSISRSASARAARPASSSRPYWQLREPEPWRLQR
jgi:hypothetical protein